ncbi:LysM peptidoglycan-binding domain-containing protein [Paenibacillus filicis]|uniref:LysM peptidoglycan-binding domain-containing protein n=1 Tax=Paenibacillus gyeongsangnamensis TaxID=3388067 RepID=A0ABT4Q739_9BACL|nr:LysM peptidoglycan-binding domain-containing protein [Paenibacillus filicis]MCZ8512678.1 LysM peptidoglycan-binding domain-containing protein [Paenibacillus filicis]
MLIHVISKGENLWLLSNMYGVTVQQIAAANALPDPSKVTIGQALVIPAPPRYTVRPGDTLWQIAQRFGTTVQALIQANPGVNPNQLYPGLVLNLPQKPKPLIEVNAFTTEFNPAGAAEVRDIGGHLTYLAPFGYKIKADGSLEPPNDVPLIQAAQSTRTVPMMAVTNFTATEPGSNSAHIILSSPEISNKALDNIVETMKSKGYRGLNVDFENILPADRELYSDFIRKTAARMHAENFFASSSLAPKTSATQTGVLYEAHDYPVHGALLDFVVLMTYEWGYRFGPPQAISPINEIKAVLDYAVTDIPRNKIMMGFELYARDWVLPHVKGQEAETFSPQAAVLRAVQYGAEIHYDPKAQSPYYRYTDAHGRLHEVWFEDARSAQAKFDLAKQYNLRGISYWVLGYPFPQNWLLLADNFRVKKLM